MIALRGLFIVPVRTLCHEFFTWYAIFHKPSQHLGKVRKHSPHRLSWSERSGKVLRDLSFLVTYRASSEHKTGCQPVLCTVIVDNKIPSKNDSERTIVRFFLFHDSRFSPKNSSYNHSSDRINLPRTHLRATIPPGIGTLQSLPVTHGDLPRITAESAFLHCKGPRDVIVAFHQWHPSAYLHAQSGLSTDSAHRYASS